MNDRPDSRADEVACIVDRPPVMMTNHERGESVDGVTGGVGVAGGERSVVTGGHCFQHVEYFCTTNFANDETIWTQPECCTNEMLECHSAASLD